MQPKVDRRQTGKELWNNKKRDDWVEKKMT
jgi:hypothetical protein